VFVDQNSVMNILVGLASAGGSWLLKAIFDRVFGRNKDLEDIRTEQRTQSDRIARIEAEASKNEALIRQDIHQIRDKMQEWFNRLEGQLDEMKQGFSFVPRTSKKPVNRKTP
jgi:acyl-CoA hydrolase